MTVAVAEESIKFSELAHWTPRQLEACQVSDTHQFTLFGGRRGPGKSYWLRWALLRQLLKAARDGIRGGKAMLACETYEVLRDRQIGPIETEFPRWMGQVKHTATHGLGFHLKPSYGSGVLQLRNLDDPGKYIGAEGLSIGVDQIEKNLVGVFDALIGNLRWPGIEKPRFLATGNPGVGIGLPWVKSLWVDRQPEERLRRLLPEVALVTGLPGDNPYLSEAYWEMLRAQPLHIQRAWIGGDWSVIEGAAFAEWQAQREERPWHVIPTGLVPEGAKAYLGVDWGFAAPWCALLIAVAHDGRLTLCRELYATQQKTSDQGAAMLALLGENKLTPAEVLAYCGHDVFARHLTAAGVYEEPIVYTWQQMGLQCVSAGRDPVHRASKLREFLRDWGPDEGWPDGRPGLQVMECCQNFIRTLPLLQLDPLRPEVVNTKMEDHCFDAGGHVWTSMPGRPVQAEADRFANLPPRARAIEEADAAWRQSLKDQQDGVHGIDDAAGWTG